MPGQALRDPRETAPSIPHQSQVQEQVIRSSKRMECIEEKMKSLYVRLEGVMVSQGPTGGDEARAKPTLVGHAMALSNHNDQLDRFDAMLGDILDRLEV